MPEFEPEGLRINCDAALQRLELLAGCKPILFVDGHGHLEMAYRRAKEQGWRLVHKKREAKAVLVFVPDGEIRPADVESFPEAQLFAMLGKSEGVPVREGYREMLRRQFQFYRSLNTLFSERLAAVKLPKPIKRTIDEVWNTLGFDRRVGDRRAAFPLSGYEELFWVRNDFEIPWKVAEAADKDRRLTPIATFFGVGRLPVFGATVVSLITMLVGLALWKFALPSFWIFWGSFLGIAILSTVGCVSIEKWARTHFLAEDPPEFVLDEVAGMALTMLFIPPSLWAQPWWFGLTAFVVAFGAFRFFDMLKIGVGWMKKRNWRGSIVWDDLAAGIWAGLITLGFSHLLLRL